MIRDGPSDRPPAGDDWLLIAWGWALAVTFGVYVAGGVSGAHISFGETVEERLTTADGQPGARGRTVRER